jgi:hypothetical protein
MGADVPVLRACWIFNGQAVPCDFLKRSGYQHT